MALEPKPSPAASPSDGARGTKPYPSLGEVLASSGTALLRRLPPEAAHDVGMWLLRRGLMEHLPPAVLDHITAGCRVTLPGIGELPHPIGLAAGFDKHCLAPYAFARMGFSFIEVGTVTPRPQSGNPKPRLFRVPESRTIINRMGFNSDGALTVSERLKALGWKHDKVPLGINVGKNKDTPLEQASTDYAQVIQAFAGLARYYVVNISSPNTVGLRDLANPYFIDELGDRIGGELAKTWIKLDPDMPRSEFERLIAAILDKGYVGVILTNTRRVTRPEVGGLSGHPLLVQATARLEWAWAVHQGRLPMIGCGGILSGSDILEKIMRGASAVQIYTALVYRGPWAVAQLLVELSHEMRQRGFETIQDAFGTYYP